MNELDYSQIDDYLMDRLDTSERKAFEDRLSSDSEFKTTVNAQQDAMMALEMLNDQHWKSRLQDIHEEMTRPVPLAPSGRRSILKWLSAAAIALIAITTYWLLPTSTASPQQLFADHYQPYELNFGSRSTEPSSPLIQAGAYYRQQSYAQALPLFNSLPDTLQSATTQLATGICQIELKQYNQALASFQPLIANNDPVFKEQAQWYAAMAYLQLEKREEARELLQALTQNAKSFQNQNAKSIIEALQ